MLRKLIVGSAAALVLLNVAAVIVWTVSGAASAVDGHSGASKDVVLAEPINEHDVLVSTVDNDVELRRDGRPVAEASFDDTVGAVAAVSDRYVVGTALGTVAILDDDLKEIERLDVGDSVVGLSQTDAGDLVIAHGAGAFSTEYSIDRYPPDAARPAIQASAAFTISALATSGTHAVYGTVNSQVGSIDLGSGDERWTTTLSHPVTSIISIADRGWVLVGEEKGNLELLDAEGGGSLGKVQLGDQPITALGYDDQSGVLIAGDRRGGLSVVNDAGDVVLHDDVVDSAIRSVGHGPDGGLLVVPENGDWVTIKPGSADAAGTVATLRPWWLALNVAVLLGLAAAVMLRNTDRREALRRVGQRAWNGRLGYLLILPTVVMLAVFMFYPAVSAFFYSLTDFSLRRPAEWVGLENYERLFTNDVYFRAGLVNMAIIVVASFVKTVTVPLLAAELIYWLRNKLHQYWFRTLFVLSSVVPALVLTLLWRQVYDPETGLLNEILGAVGLESLQRAWLGNESTALGAVIGVGFPYLSAFAFLIFLGGLLTINRELYDSAAMDGAGRWKRFRHVDLPHLRPHFRIVTFFAVIHVTSNEGVASIFILTGGGPGYSTYVPALQMYERIGTGDLGYASTIGITLFVMIMAVTIFVLRFRRSEMEET